MTNFALGWLLFKYRYGKSLQTLHTFPSCFITTEKWYRPNKLPRIACPKRHSLCLIYGSPGALSKEFTDYKTVEKTPLCIICYLKE